MNKSVFTVSIIAFFMLYACICSQAQPYYFGNPFITSYGTEDFGGGIQSWSIVQDKREILYVANNFGLLEFNGTTWKLHPVKNGTKVRAVHIGTDGNIYVGSQADFGYFSPDARGTLQYHSLADSLPPEHRNFDEVWRIYEWNSQIWFLTFRNIFIFKGNTTVDVIRPEHPLGFSFMVHNQLYVHVWNTGLCVVAGNSVQPVKGGDFFSATSIASMEPFDNGRLLIFTIREGLFLLDGDKATPFPTENTPALKGMIINHAVTLSDGSFAIGTQDNGLIIISRNGKLLLHLNRTNGLPDQTIHALYEDTQHNLWVGLNNGIAMIELSSPFSVIDGTMGLAGTGYAAVRDDKDLYLGTSNGLFYLHLEDPGRYFEAIPTASGQVYRLTKISGNILMGHHNGAYQVHDKSANLLFPFNGVWEFIPIPNQPGYLIMGSYDGISLIRSENGRFEFIRKFDGFEESSRVLAFDHEKNLWMAHGYKGIFKLTFDNLMKQLTSVSFYNSKHGFPTDHLINMERINNELIFPALFGTYKYDRAQDKFVRDDFYSSLFRADEHIVKMEQDLHGNIYFISDQRVGKLSFDRFSNATMDTRLFNKIRNKLNDDLGAIHILDPDNILFGAKNGFIHYNPSRKKEMQPFLTHIVQLLNISGEADSLIAEGKGIAALGKLELPWRRNSLRFVYASSFFEDPDKTQYQYYLENFDKGWSDWSFKTEKEYTNLPEGTYNFYVKAKNVYGTISEAKSFSFKIYPPFYRTRVAYFVYILSGGFVLTFAFYRLDKRFRKEKKLMMLRQERELHRKNSEIKQITVQSEQEIVRLKNEKLQSEIDHMNRELTSSTIHLVNKNELLNNVKLGLEDMIRRKELNGQEEELRKIIHNIDYNLNSDGDWKQFELHFNNVHGNFTHRLLETYPRLTPQEIKLCAYLRLNLTTKEIANLLNISVRGVEISRYRLRKKLMLDRNENLTDFMLKF